MIKTELLTLLIIKLVVCKNPYIYLLKKQYVWSMGYCSIRKKKKKKTKAPSSKTQQPEKSGYNYCRNSRSFGEGLASPHDHSMTFADFRRSSIRQH